MPTIKRSKYRVRYSEHRPKRIDGVSLKLPNYQQQDYHSCGFMAALTVATYYKGDNFSKEDLLMAVRPCINHGTTRHRVRKGLSSVGIDTIYREDLTLVDLVICVLSGIPVIITVFPDNWIGDHWCVVQGFAHWRVYLSNHYSLSLKDFKREWIDNWNDGSKTGAGLICEVTR